MKIALVHNAYGKFSGEEAVVRDTTDLLRAKGHEVASFFRRSAQIPEMQFGELRAFFSGLYNPASRAAFERFLDEKQPDVVHVHNVYPLISPSVLPMAKVRRVPVVMTVHNYRMVCPNGLHFVDGKVCERCIGGREYWCVLKNCEANIAKSIGYAARTWWARVRRYFVDNVDVFICLTEFQRNRLASAGILPEQMVVVPNMVTADSIEGVPGHGEYVGFSGRLSAEKGVSTLLMAARINGSIPFAAAGSYHRIPDLKKKAPANLKLLGYCDRTAMQDFYKNAKIAVLPSIWFEGFPTVIVEAMLHARPIICSDIGGLSEIVQDGVTGLLACPGEPEDLAAKIRYLWERPDLCRQMGEAGREKALKEYSAERCYELLIKAYEKAAALCAS